MNMSKKNLRVGIVAGEASGDLLGASLINALRDKVPGLSVEGIGGPDMQQAGCRSLYPMQLLSVMGLVEVLGKYLKIAGVRRALAEHFTENPPDVFIGVDAPDFNLGLEKRLRTHGIKTVHYVSPQVWAWREYRLKKIMQSVDLMLTLYPFEEAFYRDRGMAAVCVGHPLADRIPMQPDQNAARTRLGLPLDKKVVAIMPGSRKMEISRLLQPFLRAAARCLQQRDDIHFAGSLLHDEAMDAVRDEIAELGLEGLPVSLYKGKSHDVLEAADVVLLASGTIALETMLYKKPMVVAYKLNWLTYHLVKALIKVRYVSLPNLLANERIVPECLQDECTPERLAEEVLRWLNDGDALAELQQRFRKMHQDLQRNGADAASERILQLVSTS